MAKGITKRSRGRPGKMEKLLFDMQTVVLKGNEDLVEAYPTAVKYLIDVLGDKNASVTNKLSAAKTIREVVEASLNELETEEEAPEAEEINQPARLEIG